MSLPINRSAKSTLDANLVNGITSDAPAVKASDDVVYNTIDELYNYALSLVTSGTLSPLPPNNVQYQSLFNGGFVINQRVKIGTVVLTAGQYGHDRWKAGSAGCTYTFATANNITTITISAGSLLQIIEGQNLFDGTYTLSWTGTSQGKIGGGIFSTSGVTAVVTGGNDLSIEFNAGTVSKAQFNKGSTPFPYQPRSFPEELALCQRYYEKSYSYGVAPATTTNQGIETKVLPSNTIAASQVYGKTSYKVKKRTNTPTLTIYPFTTPANTGSVSAASGADLATGTGVVFQSGDDGFTVTNNTASATTNGNSVVFHWASDNEL